MLSMDDATRYSFSSLATDRSSAEHGVNRDSGVLLRLLRRILRSFRGRLAGCRGQGQLARCYFREQRDVWCDNVDAVYRFLIYKAVVLNNHVIRVNSVF